MAKIIFYLLLKPLSLLPMRTLFVLSDIIYFLMWLTIPYRKRVVMDNLNKAFPYKTAAEKIAISKGFYRHFCDLLAESVKLFSITQQEALSRFRVTNPEIFDRLAKAHKSVVLVGGHYQNWELFAVATAPQIKHQLLGIYTPITNVFMEGKFTASRTQFGLILVPKKKTSTYFEHFKDRLTVTTFAIDQCPRKYQKIYWTKFLGVDTPVHFGAEKYAKDYNYAVVFGRAVKIKRGHYELTFEELHEHPRKAPDGQITEMHTKKLEQQILAAPEYWLWTHKRWKLKKPINHLLATS